MPARRNNPFAPGTAHTRIASGVVPTIAANSELTYRSAMINRAAINADARTIEFTFSSELELERWPGVIEVLSHASEAVDMSRLRNGAQLLFNHDPDEYIGVVESATIGADRKGRCVVRFSTSDDAEKIWQDVKDGILSNVSVGYRIGEVKLTEERETGQDVYTVTRWEPYEVSIVTIPADISVGIGRNARSLFSKSHGQKHNSKNIMNRSQIIQILQSRGISFDATSTDEQLADLCTRNFQAPAVGTSGITVGEEGGQAVAAERERVRAIFETGRQYKKPELAQKAIAEGRSMDQFQQMLIDAYDSTDYAVRNPSMPIGLSDREARGFSFIKLFRALSDPQDRKLAESARFELEACEASGRQISHRTVRGTSIPTDVLMTPLGQRGDTVSIKTGSGYTGTGGATVSTTLLESSFIDLLRNRTVLMGLGAELSGLVGNTDIPKQLAGSTAYWIGEDADAPKEDIEFGLVQLSPKTVANLGEVTRKTLMQSSLSMEALFRADLARGLALEIDRAGFYGLAASNQPRGLKMVSGINVGNWATANSPTFAELVAMETQIAADNADIPSMAYVMNATMRGFLKTAEKFSGTTGATIWEPGNTVNGYRTEVTNQIATGDIFFGNFADLLIGMFGGLDITVDPYTFSSKGRVRYTVFQDVDFAHRRAESFCYNSNSI